MSKISRSDFLARALAIAGITVGVVALGSPGPTSGQGNFDARYIQRSPSANQAIQPTGPTIPLQIVSGTGDSRALLLRKTLDGTSGFDFDPSGRLMSLIGVPSAVAGVSPIFRVTDDASNIFDFLTIDRVNLLGLLGATPGLGMTTVLQADDPITPPGLFNAQSISGLGVASNLLGFGAQIGLPTPSVGTVPNTLTLGGHRHSFSGRFYLAGFFANALVGVPAKFLRFTIANNWTLRRVTAYAQTAPAGGTDSFGVVNAAGTLQGSQVTLAAGVQEAEQTQTTNLTGGTAYYLAETATTAVTQAVGINVAIEYTMNV